MKFSFSIALLACLFTPSIVMAQKFSEWRPLPGLGANIHPDRAVAMAPGEWFWTEEVAANSFRAVFLNPQSRERTEYQFEDLKLQRVSRLEHAILPGMFGVISTVLFSPEGHVVRGFMVIDRKSGEFRFVDTGSYFPRSPKISPNGFIWTVGSENEIGIDGKARELPSYHVVRVFDSSGKQVGSSVPREHLNVSLMDRNLNPARAFFGGGAYLVYLREGNSILKIEESTFKSELIPGPAVGVAITKAHATTCDGRTMYFQGEGKQSGGHMYFRDEAGNWTPHRYKQFGKTKDFWSPSIYYCSAEGIPVAAISYNELSEVR